MKLFCCFTPAHEILFTNYFAPSVSSEFSITSYRLEIAGAGDFLSSEFLQCIHQKIDLILDSIRQHQGDIIAWSDIDIQFFDLQPSGLEKIIGENDIVFQKEGPKVDEVNTGFFVCRCNQAVENFFLQVRDGLKSNLKANEQLVANQLLQKGSRNLSWGFLPLKFYARSHGWPPPRDMVIYHANYSSGANGIQKKIDQFHDVAFLRRYGWLARVLTTLKYGGKRLLKMMKKPSP